MFGGKVTSAKFVRAHIYFACVGLKQLQHFQEVIALDLFFRWYFTLYHAKSPLIHHSGWFTKDLLYGMILEVL